jgi:hypothetical protein
MKKIYLALGGLLTFAVATGQSPSENVNQSNTAKFSDAKEVPARNLVAEKGTKAIHFTEDFESGTFPPAGWAVSNGATSTVTNPDQEWHEEQNGNPGSCASVLYVNSVDQHDEWITTPVLDLSSYASSNMRIEFDFNTSQYWHVTTNDNADITLEVSIDGGTTFTSVIFQEDDSLLLANSLLDMFWETYVWTRARTDISAFAGETNVVFGWHYVGMDGAQFNLDNVSIVDIDQNDLSLTAHVAETGGVSYWSVPTTQIQPINFSAEVTNIGVADQTNTIVTVTDGATYVGTSSPITLASGGSDSSVVTAPYTPASSVATITLDWTYSSDFTDDNPTNNIATETLNITNYKYARDKGNYEAQSGGEDNQAAGDFAFEAGNDFDIVADQQAFGIDVVIGTGTPDGTIIYGKIYTYDGAYQYLDETAEYTVTAADASGNATITMPFFTFPTLTAGEVYTVVVGCYSEFYYGVSGKSPDQTSFILYGGAGGTGSQYYTNDTPMVGLNFDPSLGVAENVAGDMELGQNIPNPFNNTTTINYSVASNANVTLTLVDMTGKVVLTVNEGTKAAGDYKITLDASNLAGGMYHYTLSNGETSITKAMSVVK